MVTSFKCVDEYLTENKIDVDWILFFENDCFPFQKDFWNRFDETLEKHKKKKRGKKDRKRRRRSKSYKKSASKKKEKANERREEIHLKQGKYLIAKSQGT